MLRRVARLFRFLPLLLLPIIGIACYGSPTEPLQQLPPGTWWSDGEYSLIVLGAQAKLQAPDCYAGFFSSASLGPWGIFSQRGRYQRTAPPFAATHEALFSGRADAETINLSIAVDDGTRIGVLRLRRMSGLPPPPCPP
jgi:hypothetical protein